MDEKRGQERRQHKRVDDIFTVTYRLRSTIDVTIQTPEQEYTGVAVDICEGGVGVEVAQKIPTGTPLRLRFTIVNTLAASESARQRTFDLEGQSRHCQPTEKNRYRAGILFNNITAEESRFISDYVRVQLLKKTPA